MVDKVKSWDWPLINKIVLLLGNIGVIAWISLVTMHTKSLDNTSVLLSYAAIGFVSIILFKFNNVFISTDSEV